MYDAKLDGVPQLILAGQTNSSLLGTKAFQETILLTWYQMYLFTVIKSKGDNVFEVVNEAIRTAYEKKA